MGRFEEWYLFYWRPGFRIDPRVQLFDAFPERNSPAGRFVHGVLVAAKAHCFINGQIMLLP